MVESRGSHHVGTPNMCRARMPPSYGGFQPNLTDPRRAGQPGLSSVSPRGNRFPTLPPSVLSLVFETDLVPFKVPKIKLPRLAYDFRSQPFSCVVT